MKFLKGNLLNYFLFLFTLLSTTFAGILFYLPFYNIVPTDSDLIAFLSAQPIYLLSGFFYSFSVLFILLAHEIGHYLACRHHRVSATLPYFIPSPLLFGTFGAVIKIRKQIPTRKALFDIGVAGPLAGFFIGLPLVILGISQSKIIPLHTEGTIVMGDPLIFKFFFRIFFPDLPAGQSILIHPIGIAAWLGMLATSLNLFPVSQLDGGHICYALFREKAKIIGRVFVIMMIFLGIFLWRGWLFWALLITIIGVDHPPLIDDQPLSGGRLFLAIVTLLIFVLTFIPAPLSVSR